MQKFLGCSGFQYKDWKGIFYPEDITKKQWLSYYASVFNSVEINSTFYNFPKEETIKHWYNETPANFQFTFKGSKYITHQKKLKRDEKLEESVSSFFERASVLQEKTGCILWQFPPSLHRNDEKLKNFCELLSKDFKQVIEFRHSSWFEEEVYDILRNYNVILCLVSAPINLPQPEIKTSDTTYIRFHGKTTWYDYDYSHEELNAWKNTIEKLAPKEVYAYFNNDMHGYGPKNCQYLQEQLKNL